MFKLIINNEPNRYTNALTIERARKLLNSRLIEESCRLLLTLSKKSNIECCSHYRKNNSICRMQLSRLKEEEYRV